MTSIESALRLSKAALLINVLLAGEPERFGDGDDSQWFVLGSVQSDFRGEDFPVEPVLALGIGLTTVSESSDVNGLSSSPRQRL